METQSVGSEMQHRGHVLWVNGGGWQPFATHARGRVNERKEWWCGAETHRDRSSAFRASASGRTQYWRKRCVHLHRPSRTSSTVSVGCRTPAWNAKYVLLGPAAQGVVMPVWPTLEQVGVCAASSSNEPDGTVTVFWQSPSLLLVQIALQALKAVLTYGLAYIFGAQRLGKLLAVAVFLYPLWSPVGRAIKQNSAMRAYAYMALFVGTLTSVHLEPSKRYPDRVAIEIQDEDGHVLTTSIPGGQRMVSGLETGSQVCTVVMSDDESFARPAQISDLYFPFQNRFVGAYPYVNKNAIKRLQRKAEQGREP